MVIEEPLAPWSAGMAQRLEDLGYAPGSARNRLALVAQLSRHLKRRGLSATDDIRVELERFCSSLARSGHSSPTPKSFVWLIEFLRDIGLEPPTMSDLPRSEVEEMVWRYRRFVLDERGLEPDTVTTYVRALTPFVPSTPLVVLRISAPAT